MPRNIPNTETFTGGPYRLPEAGDRGQADVFAILEETLERLATHSHTGQDSNEIALNITKDQSLKTVGVDLFWIDQGNDVYRAEIQVPPSTTYDESLRRFFFEDGPNNFLEFYPEAEKIDDNRYYIYSNDNSINVKVVTI